MQKGTPKTTEPGSKKDKNARKRFTTEEDHEILVGNQKYGNCWQVIVDNSPHLSMNNWTACSVGQCFKRIGKKVSPKDQGDKGVKTPVDRKEIISSLLDTKETELAREVVEKQRYRQKKYLLDTAAEPKLKRVNSEGSLSSSKTAVKLHEMKEYLAVQQAKRKEDKDERKRKLEETRTVEATDSKEEIEKEKKKEEEKEKNPQDKKAEVEKWRKTHDKQSQKRCKLAAEQKKKEQEDAFSLHIELTKKFYKQQAKEQEDNHAMVAELLAVAKALLQEK